MINQFSFKVLVDSTNFGAYTREGLVENVKVPKKVSYHSLKQSLHNPVASSSDGMLITPDLGKFGRSDILHLSFCAVFQFQKDFSSLPTTTDFQAVLAYVKKINEANKTSGGINIEDINEKVVLNVSSYCHSCLSPMAAFFGGIVAQEIVKLTGKYSPLKQWLHFDIFETLPRIQVDRTPMNCRYDD